MNLDLTAADLMVVLGSVTGLIGLWLRLSWRAQQERARRRTLVDLVEALRQDSQLEEQAADGTWLRITVGSQASRPDDTDQAGRVAAPTNRRAVTRTSSTAVQRRGQQ
jgi:hypothetical protein